MRDLERFAELARRIATGRRRPSRQKASAELSSIDRKKLLRAAASRLFAVSRTPEPLTPSLAALRGFPGFDVRSISPSCPSATLRQCKERGLCASHRLWESDDVQEYSGSCSVGAAGQAGDRRRSRAWPVARRSRLDAVAIGYESMSAVGMMVERRRCCRCGRDGS